MVYFISHIHKINEYIFVCCIYLHKITEPFRMEETSQDRIREWVGSEGTSDLKDHLVPTALPWAWALSTRPGHSKAPPTWP